MRVAAIYDIHGNLPALEAVIDDIHRIGVDQIVVGGDVIPGPQPRETISALMELSIPTRFIQGNGERETIALLLGNAGTSVPEAVREAILWVGQQLDAEQIRQLNNWPSTVGLTIPDFGDVLFCHATPRNDFEIFTCTTPEDRVLPAFEGVRESTAVCGHTHMQFDRMVGNVRVLNAGSVGMPFGQTGAHWLLIESDVNFQRTKYDLAGASNRIRATAYPQADDFANQYVTDAPSEAKMLELFERTAM